MRKRILILDLMAVLHNLKYSIKNPQKHPDKNVYIINGFLYKLYFLINKVRPSLIVFANDSGHHGDSLRHQIFKGYKDRHSNKTKQQIMLDKISIPQFRIIKEEIIDYLGYKNFFSLVGLEADDIIASICKEYQNRFDIVIVSTDGDLYQLLSKSVCILNAKTNKYFGYKDFVKKYGIKPNKWAKAKIIGGCKSDTVPGIPGVAETTAINFIKGELPEHYKSYKEIVKRKNKKILLRNRKLVKLPFKGTPSFRLKRDVFHKKHLLSIAKQYELKAIIKDIDDWTRKFTLR